MTAPITWLTVSVAADRLGRSVEAAQELVDAGLLHERWIHDHWAIAEASVTAYLAAQQGGA